MTDEPKPRKRDFVDMRDFLRASSEWAERNRCDWPWSGPADEDDEVYFVLTRKGHEELDKLITDDASSGGLAPLASPDWNAPPPSPGEPDA